MKIPPMPEPVAAMAMANPRFSLNQLDMRVEVAMVVMEVAVSPHKKAMP